MYSVCVDIAGDLTGSAGTPCGQLVVFLLPEGGQDKPVMDPTGDRNRHVMYLGPSANINARRYHTYCLFNLFFTAVVVAILTLRSKYARCTWQEKTDKHASLYGLLMPCIVEKQVISSVRRGKA